MTAKRIIIITTIAFTLVFSCDFNPAAAKVIQTNAQNKTQNAEGNLQNGKITDPLLHELGAPNDEALYEALYNGHSLADMAYANGKAIQPVVDLQTAELTAQLVQRLNEGQISLEQFMVYQSELKEIISQSVHTTFEG